MSDKTPPKAFDCSPFNWPTGESPPNRMPRKGTAASCELKLIDCPSESSEDDFLRAERYQKMLIKSVRDSLVEATDPEYYSRSKFKEMSTRALGQVEDEKVSPNLTSLLRRRLQHSSVTYFS